MSLIETRGLTLRHDGQTALRDVNFNIEPGEIVTIVGPNGSGKSSLLRALIGALKPAAGKVSRKSGLRIGYVPQKLQIDATLPLTVRRFVNLPRRQKPEAIRDALATAGVPELAERQMVDLSGGQFQRVLLARALLEAGLLGNCAIHGLRKAAAGRLAEIGCTTHQIMAITGHKTMKEVERYTEEYRRLEAAFEAFEIWENAA